jgi:hypothetical protein
MLIVEIIGAVLVLALAVVVTAGFYLGVLASIGALRLTRCRHCGHLGISAPREPLLLCSRCRHPHLLHPLRVHHHTGSPPMPLRPQPHGGNGTSTTPPRSPRVSSPRGQHVP